MILREMIFKRRSVRRYKKEPVKLDLLEALDSFVKGVTPLFPSINTSIEINNKENVKCILPWTTEKVICIFSEEKDGYLENAGFMLQQVDLYAQSLGLGTCWLGMGKLDSHAISHKNEKLKFVIMLAFGYPKDERYREISGFRRKKMLEISDKDDERLEPARLAPSSVNSQPWYFTHSDEYINVYCEEKGFFKPKSLSTMNVIDVGIAISHMYISNKDTFIYEKKADSEFLKEYKYIGSFKI